MDRPVYLPPGTFRVDRHIVVDDVTLVGAGNWHTVLKGRQVTLAEPAPDGSRHTGVGLYGKPAAEGGRPVARGYAPPGSGRLRSPVAASTPKPRGPLDS
ncbi:hypothetical protein EAO70_01970 [Streptomyces sp. adm13(2018)]|nr:hypothetical protein EAO70_01970 [Streptomyces sp. adm13(2018)]